MRISFHWRVVYIYVMCIVQYSCSLLMFNIGIREAFLFVRIVVLYWFFSCFLSPSSSTWERYKPAEGLERWIQRVLDKRWPIEIPWTSTHQHRLWPIAGHKFVMCVWSLSRIIWMNNNEEESRWSVLDRTINVWHKTRIAVL